MQATYDYTPFGQETQVGGDSSASTPLLYDGQLTDTLGGSGLIYMRARWYDPVTMQFMSRDPAVSQTLQPYSYAMDDPLDVTDLSGLDSCYPFVCIPNPLSGLPRAGKVVAHFVIDAATDPLYLSYWGAYSAASKINELGCRLGSAGCVAAHVIAWPLVQTEVEGLTGDALGDYLKSLFLKYPGICDEDIPNQYVLGSQAGPVVRRLGAAFGQSWNWRTSFPGIHEKTGQIDLQW